ncbi:MAG: sulfotransferase [Calditrichaeota bacterium]|nr:MAG: sulfotransferase [Calditrichota bacterium]MBL1204521.1 sulfotransferase [Calditrichota bacterium]NOG44349.1 sulfotransferase [Calditrichota bacterium]
MKKKPIRSLVRPLVIKLGKRIADKQFSGTPIIIGACPRSGTTILLSVLGAHPNIFAIPNQSYAFDQWVQGKTKIHGDNNLVPFRIDRLYREFLYSKVPPGPTRWLEKTPKHIRSFHKILDYMGENVQLIHVIRDGRDVVTSKHPKHSPGEYWVPVNRWIDDVSLGLSLKNHPQVLNIRYEDFIQDFEKTMNTVYSFLNEEIPSLDAWKEETNIKKSKHWNKPVQGLYKDAIQRWQKPEHKNRIDEFMSNKRAVSLLEELGYL